MQHTTVFKEPDIRLGPARMTFSCCLFNPQHLFSSAKFSSFQVFSSFFKFFQVLWLQDFVVKIREKARRDFYNC